MKKLAFPNQATIEKITAAAAVQQAGRGVLAVQFAYGSKVYDLVLRSTKEGNYETEGMIRNCGREKISGETTAIISAAIAWMREYAEAIMCQIEYTFTTHDPKLRGWLQAASGRLKLKQVKDSKGRDKKNPRRNGKSGSNEVVYRRTLRPPDQIHLDRKTEQERKDAAMLAMAK